MADDESKENVVTTESRLSSMPEGTSGLNEVRNSQASLVEHFEEGIGNDQENNPERLGTDQNAGSKFTGGLASIMGQALQDKLEAEYAKNIKSIYEQDIKEKLNSKIGGSKKQTQLWQRTNEENENDALYDICNELNDENAA